MHQFTSMIVIISLLFFLSGKQDDNNDVQLLEGKDGWVDVSDDEDQEKWRKMRFEREAFLAANAVR